MILRDPIVEVFKYVLSLLQVRLVTWKDGIADTAGQGWQWTGRVPGVSLDRRVGRDALLFLGIEGPKLPVKPVAYEFCHLYCPLDALRALTAILLVEAASRCRRRSGSRGSWPWNGAFRFS